MNLGIVAYLKGDIEKARQLVDQASRQGLKEATQQLEEFKKIQKNN
jgi:hypothetical protein